MIPGHVRVVTVFYHFLSSVIPDLRRRFGVVSWAIWASQPGSRRILTRLKSDRPSESRRPESVLAMFKKISSFFGRPSSMFDGLLSAPIRYEPFRARP